MLRFFKHITVKFLIVFFILISGSCKKKLNGPCNKDKDCKSGLTCVGHKCRKHIDCEHLKNQYHKCITDILTVRNPSFKPSKTDIALHIKKFDDSYYKECKNERGAYDDPGIEKCLQISDCKAFSKCLLSLEK